MQTRYLYLLKYVLPITDIFMLNIVYLLAYFVTNRFGRDLSIEFLEHHVVVCNLIWFFVTSYFNLYSEYGARKIERIYRETWKSIVGHLFLFSVFLLFEKDQDFSRAFMLSFYLLLVSFCIVNRMVGTSIQFMLTNKFKARKKVAVLGNNRTGTRLGEYLNQQRNVEFYGFIAHDKPLYNEHDVLTEQVIAEMEDAAAHGVNDLYVAVAPERISKIHKLLLEADKYCLRLKFVPDIAGSLASPYVMHYIGGEFPIITLRHEPLEKMGNRFKKRLFDVVFSSLVILLILSWLYPLLALLIKLQGKGPVIFKQLRSGRNDKPFWCYKFRSMRLNEASDKQQASKNDDRITPIGKFLRRTSLDELPQFLNVLMGEMSVVGPRPHMLQHTTQYKAIISQFMVRQYVKPGITGWAQVNGCRGETKEDSAMDDRVRHDIWYLENWSGMLDVKVIFMTIFNVVKGEDNAY